MKFFVDTAEIDDIKELAAIGLLDGVTTNPTLIAKSGRPFKEVLTEICATVDGPVSAEVAATDYDGIMAEAKVLAEIADNITIKVPLIMDGLKACKSLTSAGHKVNVTLCFSASQALLAAKAGATFISPFIGRLDDISHNGLELIQEIRAIYDNFDNLQTEILAASIRSPVSVKDVAIAGADVATIPPSVFGQLVKHPLTDNGLERFLADWKATGQTII